MHIYICLKLFAEHCACASPSTIPHPTRLSPDQEIDDFAVAQSTPLPECIAGCEGDTVRRPSFTVPTFIQHSHRFCKRMPSLVQGGDTYAEGFGITILIPKNFRHESFEAEEAAKELTIKAKATEAKAEAKAEPKEAEQTTKKSAAAKLAGTKQKIKKHAAAAKEVAPASKPVTASPPCYALCGRLTKLST